MIKKIIIKNNDKGKRLDKFLSEYLKNETRSQIKKMIENGLILINGKKTKVHHFLKIEEKISISLSAKISKNKNIKETEKDTQKLKPKIIFEDNDFLVLEKPSGMLTHSTDLGEKNTMADWLAKKYPEITNIGENKYRGGIIHRLDKDVSGVIVAAKNNQAFNNLKEQFKKRQVKKIYIALVYGKIENSKGEINLPIGRNKNGQFVAHPKKKNEKLMQRDKFAKTAYKVLKYIKDYTLLEIQIFTGRTHQIRAHFQAIGHPIIGDPIYKPKNKFLHFLRKKIKVIDVERIFLHSQKIGFKNTKNEWVEFFSPLPDKLKKILDGQKK